MASTSSVWYVPSSNLDDLRQQVDLRDLVADHWGPGKQAGKAVQYKSPWRDDGRHGSFTVYADGWKDFGGSGESGDVFTWIMYEYHLDFPGAVRWLQAYLGHPQPIHSPQPKTVIASAQHEPPALAWQQAARQALAAAQACLWQTPPILDYLHQARGLNNDTIHRAGLGYNPGWTKTNCRKPDGQPAFLPPGIVIPITQGDTLWALRVRSRVGNLAAWLGLPDEMGRDGEPLPKYLNLAGSRLSGSMYNADTLSPDRDVLVLEGEFDVLLAEQQLQAANIRMAVVTLGSASNRLSDRQQAQLHSASRVFTALDQDEAGAQATAALANALGDQITPLRLPAGKDITDYVVQFGGDLAQWWRQAQPSAWFADGLPDSWRSALLAYFKPSFALVVELLNDALRGGCIDGQAFTLPELLSASVSLGYGLARKTLYAIVAEMEGLFVQKIDTESGEQVVSDFGTNAAKGRKAICYRVRDLTAIRQWIIAYATPRIFERAHQKGGAVLAHFTPPMLRAVHVAEGYAEPTAVRLNAVLQPAYQRQGQASSQAYRRAHTKHQRLIAGLDEPHSTPLPAGWPLASVAHYRAAFLRGYIAADPDLALSRQAIADLLGMAPGSIDPIVERAGLEPVPHYPEILIVESGDPARQVRDGARELKAFPLWVIARHPDGQVRESAYRPDTSSQEMALALAAGWSVSVRCQAANTFVMVRDTPLERQARKSAAARPENTVTTASTNENKPEMRQQEAFYGPAYNPVWVKAQLQLGMLLLGWQVYQEQLVNPDTGEIVAIEPLAMLEALTGIPFTPREVVMADGHRYRQVWPPLASVG